MDTIKVVLSNRADDLFGAPYLKRENLYEIRAHQYEIEDSDEAHCTAYFPILPCKHQRDNYVPCIDLIEIKTTKETVK